MIRLIRLPEVMDRVGMSRSTIYLYIQRGLFPSPVKIGGRSVAWNSEEIDSWIQAKLSDGSKLCELPH